MLDCRLVGAGMAEEAVEVHPLRPDFLELAGEAALQSMDSVRESTQRGVGLVDFSRELVQLGRERSEWSVGCGD